MNPIRHLFVIVIIGLIGFVLLRFSSHEREPNEPDRSSTKVDATDTPSAKTTDRGQPGEPAVSNVDEQPERTNGQEGAQDDTVSVAPENDRSSRGVEADPTSQEDVRESAHRTYARIAELAGDRNSQSPPPEEAEATPPRNPDITRQTAETYRGIATRIQERGQ